LVTQPVLNVFFIILNRPQQGKTTRSNGMWLSRHELLSWYVLYPVMQIWSYLYVQRRCYIWITLTYQANLAIYWCYIWQNGKTCS